MFNNDTAINHILKELRALINYCNECKAKTDYNSPAWDIYNDTEYQLVNIHYDIATNDWDEEEDEEDEDEI